ncbi:MAG: M50 family metallopeptidase [Rickettsiales bacterium]|jgi:regulator of sigma E protease|nr:M50 family metallopeptidase [Rickettsiales bacterium]
MQDFSILFTSAAAFLIIISVVVFVHEIGHYLVARSHGVRVDEFSIGMGKKIFGWRDRRNTLWKICLIPCGGSCKFFGDEDTSSLMVDRSKISGLSEGEKNLCLQCKSPWQRIQVAVAGPLFNYSLAFLLFTLFFCFQGIDRLSNGVGFVAPNSAAERGGIMVGDSIVTLDGKKTTNFEEIQQIVLSSSGEPMTVEIVRNNEIVKKTVTPTIMTKKGIFGRTTKIPLLGIGSSDSILREKVGLARASNESLRRLGKITAENGTVLLQIILGRHRLNGIGGPVRIAKYSGMAIRGGFYVFIQFMALISVSLGFMNLLPIPVLDGGHVLLCLLEIVRRKPLSEKVENDLTKICFSILMILMIIFTLGDIIGIFNEK